MFIPDPNFSRHHGSGSESKGQKKGCHVPPPESNVCVGQERRVEVTNVWRGIHVEYGRGDETRGRIHPALLA
jgi:hypothetical protein